MKKLFYVIFVFILIGSINNARAQQYEVFKHKATVADVVKNIPEFKSVSCKFTQEKTSGQSNIVLKSGGNFKFIKEKEIIFETTYPIQAVSTYSTTQNKQVRNIINAITNKNYSYIEKSFDIYFTKQNSWYLGLKPKYGSNIEQQINFILINGNKNIEKMIFDSKNGITKIEYNCAG